MIGWLDKVAAVLQPTAFADLFEAFVEKRRRPTLRQVADNFWAHTTIPESRTPTRDDALAACG